MAAMLMAGAAGIAILSEAAQPALTFNASFLFSDQGHNLLVAQTLLSGGRLYRDVFSQYGPIPAYVHAASAALFGNTPQVYVAYLTGISAVNVGLAYLLVRRAANIVIATCVTVAVIALSVEPGSLVGGYTVAAYLPLERTALLLVALGWRRPDARTYWQSIWLGCVLGAWQGVKFGGAAFAGGAVVLIDIAWLSSAGWPAGRLRRWLSSIATIAAGFAAIQLIWVVWAVSALKPALAFDVLWPAYMMRQYDRVTPELRWIAWDGWRLMTAQYLLPAAAGVVSVVAFGRWLAGVRRSPESTGAPERIDAAAVFVPLFFFALAFFFYFRMVHHFRQFMWTLAPAAAWELERRGVALRAAVAFAWAPGVGMVLKGALMPTLVGLTIAVGLPSGGTIYVLPDMLERIQFLQRFITSEAPGAPVLFLDAASGWLYAYGVPHATRHSWVWAPGVVRPYDESEFIAALDRTIALIDCQDNGQAGAPSLPYPPAVVTAIRSRIRPWTSGAGCWAYHLRRQE